MNKNNYGKQWRQSFFEVSDWGRSSFRLLIIGICFILIWWISAMAEVPYSLYRAIRPFGVLGIIFGALAVTGPSLEVMIRFMADKKK